MESLAKIVKFAWERKEGLIWICALVFLALQDPGHHHYTLCPLNNLGFSFCPGCGLGRAIAWFFRGDLEASLMAHPMGIPAVVLLLYRSYRVLTRTHLKVETARA